MKNVVVRCLLLLAVSLFPVIFHSALFASTVAGGNAASEVLPEAKPIPVVPANPQNGASAAAGGEQSGIVPPLCEETITNGMPLPTTPAPPPSPVPIPGSGWLLASGTLGILAWRRSRTGPPASTHER